MFRLRSYFSRHAGVSRHSSARGRRTRVAGSGGLDDVVSGIPRYCVARARSCARSGQDTSAGLVDYVIHYRGILPGCGGVRFRALAVNVDTGAGAIEYVIRRGSIVVAAKVDPIQKKDAGRWTGCDVVGSNIVVVGGLRPVCERNDRALGIAHGVSADGYMVAACSSRVVEENAGRTVTSGRWGARSGAIRRIDVNIIGYRVARD